MAIGLEWSEEALADLHEAIDNLWIVSKAYAERFADAHDEVISNLQLFPMLGLKQDGRFATHVRDFGYRIIYEFEQGKVTIIRLENMRRLRGAR